MKLVDNANIRGMPNSSNKLNLMSFLWRAVGHDMKRGRWRRKAMTHLPVQTWTEPYKTQMSLNCGGGEGQTRNMECALYDVQGVSMSHPIDEDAYLIEGLGLGLKVLRLKDGIEPEICDKTN
jgi:hypothetical protein